MKYTICGFNQLKLVEYGLDCNDALILRWLVDFAATGKMKKLLDNKIIYYQVIYEAIIKEFPVMGLNNTKSISNKFDKYVKNGLLIKKRGGSNAGGSQTLYAITEKLADMCYENSEVNQSNSAMDHHTDEPPLNQKAERNNYSSRENPGNSQKAERNEYSSRDVATLLEQNENSSQKEQSFHPNGTNIPLALNNHSLNQSIINSSSTTSAVNNSLQTNSAEEKKELQKIMNYYVDTHNFSEDFLPKLYEKLIEFKIDVSQYKDFIDYAYTQCSRKVTDKTKLMSYIYNTVCDNYFISSFIETVKTKSPQITSNNYVICPICHTKHAKYESCPVCELQNLNNDAEIKFRTQIYNLSPEKKNALNKELDNLIEKYISNMSINKFILQKQEKEQLYKRYINITHEDYIKIFG